MSASKRKGTGWESAVVAYLKENGVAHAERRALNGSTDRGDVAGIPGVVIECKNEKAVSLAAYADETERERVNDGARHAAAWIKRRGKASPADGYVLLSGAGFLRLLADAGYIPPKATVVEHSQAPSSAGWQAFDFAGFVDAACPPRQEGD